MSVWIPCKCEKPVKRKELLFWKIKNWVVIRRNYNRSYFERPKGGIHFSEYTLVHCKNCFGRMTTKSNYVDKLKDGDRK